MPALIFTAWSASVLGTSALGLIATRRPWTALLPPTAAPVAPASVQTAESCDPGDPLSPDPDVRRRPQRRPGEPALVLIADPAGAIYRGCVLSASPVGLHLRVERPISKGTLIMAKAYDAPDGVSPIAATVRMCRPMDVLFQIGCEFTTRPPVSTLLTFG